MFNFTTYDLVKWLHLIALALGGGSAMIILILVGFEDDHEELKGMTSILWKRTAAWGFRLAVVLGIVLLVLRLRDGDHPFDSTYLHWKLTLVFLLLMCSELSGKALAKARRGAAMLALLFFLMASFVAVNKDAFPPTKRPGPAGGGSFTGAVQQGSDSGN